MAKSAGTHCRECKDVFFTDLQGGLCEDCRLELREESMRVHEAYEDSSPIDGVGFANPGSGSALRAATTTTCFWCGRPIGKPTDNYCSECGHQLNPRKFPCPTCERGNKLTRLDVVQGYQCDSCANSLERGLDPS